MADVQGLYLVTGIVLTALVAWVILVLVRAPAALDESQPTTVRPPPLQAPRLEATTEALAPEVAPEPAPEPSPPEAQDPAPDASSDPNHPSAEPFPLVVPSAPDVAAVAAASIATSPPLVAVTEPAQAAATPAVAPAAVTGASPSPGTPNQGTPSPGTPNPGASGKGAPVRTMLGLPNVLSQPSAATPAVPGAAPVTAAPVVVLPPMRSHLDSHPEIQDSPPNATVVVMPDEKTGGKAAALQVLVSAVGRSEPASGRLPESHSVAPQHHLFVFADGSGKKVGAELASSIAVQSITEGFEKDEASAAVDDPKLPARANRVRRAVLATNKLLLQRARTAGYAGLGTSAFAAYFSPSNEDLFLAHVGANRAYRLRGGELTRLTTPHGARFLGIRDKVEVEVVAVAAQTKDVYLFCSDGLGRALGDSELLAVLTADPSLEGMTKRLIEAVRGKDNAEDLLAIAVRVDPAAAPPKKDTGRAKTVMGLGKPV